MPYARRNEKLFAGSLCRAGILFVGLDGKHNGLTIRVPLKISAEGKIVLGREHGAGFVQTAVEMSRKHVQLTTRDSRLLVHDGLRSAPRSAVWT